MSKTYKEPGKFLSYIYKNLLLQSESYRDNIEYFIKNKLWLSKYTTNIRNLIDDINSYLLRDNYISSVLDVINLLTYESNYKETSDLT